MSIKTLILFSFFFNDTTTTEIYTLSLHDALPILVDAGFENQKELTKMQLDNQKEIVQLHFSKLLDRKSGSAGMPRPISYAVFCLKKKTISLEKIKEASHGVVAHRFIERLPGQYSC